MDEGNVIMCNAQIRQVGSLLRLLDTYLYLIDSMPKGLQNADAQSVSPWENKAALQAVTLL